MKQKKRTKKVRSKKISSTKIMFLSIMLLFIIFEALYILKGHQEFQANSHRQQVAGESTQK